MAKALIAIADSWNVSLGPQLTDHPVEHDLGVERVVEAPSTKKAPESLK